MERQAVRRDIKELKANIKRAKDGNNGYHAPFIAYSDEQLKAIESAWAEQSRIDQTEFTAKPLKGSESIIVTSPDSEPDYLAIIAISVAISSIIIGVLTVATN